MNQKDLLDLARKYFIFDAGLGEAHLIRKIQLEQGHVDCFATGKSGCDQMTCGWRMECLGGSPEDAPAGSSPINTGGPNSYESNNDSDQAISGAGRHDDPMVIGAQSSPPSRTDH